MSALTKVFVVLLVVLSLLLAAASVTFLTTLPDFRTQVATLTAAQTAAETARSRAVSAESAGRAAAESRATQLLQEVNAANSSVAEIRALLAQEQARAAELQGQLAQASTQQTTLSTAVNNSTTLVNTLRQEVATLRETNDRTLQQNLDLSRTLATTSNDLEYTQRALRAAEEQNKDISDRVTQLGGQLRGFGVDPERAPTPGSVAPPAISGVVVARQTIGGQQYAMISVGSEDDVKPGMRFNVLDAQTRALLGFVTIETVDDQMSVGKISGPKAGEIGPDDEVRTQI